MVELVGSQGAASFQVIQDEGIFRIHEPVPVLLGIFDGAVVFGTTVGAVDRDNMPPGQDCVDFLVIEIAPIVALDEQGSPMFAEEYFQMCADLFTGGEGTGVVKFS